MRIKMCAVDSNTKRLYSNEMSDRATHFTVFMIMNCPVEQQILAAYIAGKWFKCCSMLRSNKVFQHSKCEEIC